MLQQVPAINKIKKTIIRHVLSELKKQAGKNKRNTEILAGFGLVIKKVYTRIRILERKSSNYADSIHVEKVII